jgi:hypothetical protein
VHSASLAKLRHALWPHATEQAQKALDEVTVATVRAAVRRFLAREHRVVVTTIPRPPQEAGVWGARQQRPQREPAR